MKMLSLRPLKHILCATLICSLLGSPVYASAPESAAVSQSRLTLIESALYTFKSDIDFGRMSLASGAQQFADHLYQNGITSAEIQGYVRANSSPKEMESFEAALATSMKGLKGTSLETLSEKERAQVLALAIQSTRTEGVSWSGCTGATIGVILIVAAVVVGIVAITKSAGERRIQARFDDSRASRSQQYLADKTNLLNEKQNLQREIGQAQSSITYNNNQISYYTGVLAGANLNTPEGQATAQNAQAKLKYFQDQNSILNSRISELNLKLALFDNPQYMNTRLSALEQDYELDMRQFDVDEANAIALVPENQRLARGLGIGAGVGGAIGTYLAIDGFQSCN